MVYIKLNKISILNLDIAITDLRYIKEKIEEVIKKDYTRFEDNVSKKYISIQNVAELAKKINEQGIKIENRKFTGKDVVEIIKSNETEVGKVAKSIFNYNNTIRHGKKSIRTFLKELKT